MSRADLEDEALYWQLKSNRLEKQFKQLETEVHWTSKAGMRNEIMLEDLIEKGFPITYVADHGTACKSTDSNRLTTSRKPLLLTLIFRICKAASRQRLPLCYASPSEKSY